MNRKAKEMMMSNATKVEVVKLGRHPIGMSHLSCSYRVSFSIPGYRVPDKQLPWNTYRSLLNWLCAKFNEEGEELANDKDIMCVNSDKWFIRCRKSEYTEVSDILVIVADLSILEEMAKEFNWVYDIQIGYAPSVPTVVEDIVKKHLFSRITDKLIRKLQVEIAAAVSKIDTSIQWYNVKIAKDLTRIDLPTQSFRVGS